MPEPHPDVGLPTLLWQMFDFVPPWNLNMGPTGAVLVPLGLVGLVLLFRRSGRRPGAFFLASLLLLMVGVAASAVMVVLPSEAST